MKQIITSIIVATTALWALAGTPQEDIAAQLTRSASNHAVYPEDNLPSLTPAPAGYEAFYIDHYGRHGSRWLGRSAYYQRPVDVLARAHSNGLLTEQGERLLTTLKVVLNASTKRAGELTDKGAEQLQRITQRMYRNFPSVFAGNATVEARSSVVIRCILSMQNATMTLRSLNPNLRINTDASYHDMHYMGYGYGEDTLAYKLQQVVRVAVDSIYRENVHPERFARQLFTHPDSIDHSTQQRFMRDVFDIAGSLQGHHAFDNMDLYHLFTGDEIFNLWRLRNIEWYVTYGNSPAHGGRVPYFTRTLMRDMLDKADAAIATGQHGASLRYGHESITLPLACLLELGDINYSTADLDNLHTKWRSYEIIPKACNIQLVFYRNAAHDILVKALYNEHEVSLPVATDTAPYYRWSDVRAYYHRKLAIPIDWNP